MNIYSDNKDNTTEGEVTYVNLLSEEIHVHKNDET